MEGEAILSEIDHLESEKRMLQNILKEHLCVAYMND